MTQVQSSKLKAQNYSALSSEVRALRREIVKAFKSFAF